MSNCNTHNCCFKGIDLVIKCYDPQPDFTDFTIPTWWFNRCNGKLFLLKEIDNNGKAVWIDITSGGSTIEGIQEIITQCGLIHPDDEGKIKVKGTCGIRLAAEGCEDLCVNVLTGFGLKGGGQVCVGETITIELDAEITGDVRSEGTPQIGDVAKYKEADRKVIVPSNINSIDGLTKITRDTKGEQKLLVETLNDEAGSDAAVEAKCTGIGYPYFQLTSDNTKWRDTVNPVTKNRTIFPIIDGTSKDPILTMLPNGVMTGNLQPKASARFTQSTPIFALQNWFQVGSNLAFEKLRDEDGYNKSANNFFPGDGNGNGAYYKFPYKGVWCVQYQFLIEQSTTRVGSVIEIRLTWGKEGSYQSLRENSQFAGSIQPLSNCRLLTLEKDDVCFVEIKMNESDPNIKPFIYAQSDIRSIDSYIGFFLVIG